MKKSNLAVCITLVVIALLSVVFRFFDVFEPQVMNHEWHSSTVLRHLTIWYEDGFLAHRGLPVTSFAGVANKNINNHASVEQGRLLLSDTSGNYFYTSYPPFGYYAPYFIFKFIGVEPHIIGIRLFNIAVQIGTAFFIFLLLYRITSQYFIGILGYILYIFLPISFFTHTMNYMSDMFSEVFFAALLWLFYLIIIQKQEESKPFWRDTKKIAFIVTLALMIYTDWLGLFFAGSVFLFGLLRIKSPFGLFFIFGTTFTSVFVVTIVSLQYMSIEGFLAFIHVMSDRYLSGYAGENHGAFIDVVSLKKLIFEKYVHWFKSSSVIILALIAMVAVRAINKQRDLITKIFEPAVLGVIFVTIFTILSHNFIFLDWSAFRVHSFSVLKAVILFSILIPLLTYAVWYAENTKTVVIFRISIIGLLIFTLLSSYTLYEQMRYDDELFGGTEECELGNYIQKNTADNEVAFIKTQPVRDIFPISANIVLCAHRNIEVYLSDEEASELLRKNGLQKAAIYTVDYFENRVHIMNLEKMKVQ